MIPGRWVHVRSREIQSAKQGTSHIDEPTPTFVNFRLAGQIPQARGSSVHPSILHTLNYLNNLNLLFINKAV